MSTVEPLLGTPRAPSATLRGSVHEWLASRGGRTSIAFEHLTTALIILNIVSWVLSTEDAYDLGSRFSGAYDGLEAATVYLFGAEYVLRLWSCTEDPKYGRHGWLGGRAVWLVSFFSLVDMLAVVPYFAQRAAGAADPESTVWVRIFRLLRVMELRSSYGAGFGQLGTILAESKQLLVTSGFVGFATWIILSSFYYLAERDNPLMQRGEFDSIASSAYFTLVNLFGEFPLANNHSTPGKFVAVLTAVLGVAVMGIPTGILGAGFEDMMEAAKDERKEAKEAQRALALAAAADGGPREEEEEEGEGKRGVS